VARNTNGCVAINLFEIVAVFFALFYYFIMDFIGVHIILDFAGLPAYSATLIGTLDARNLQFNCLQSSGLALRRCACNSTCDLLRSAVIAVFLVSCSAPVISNANAIRVVGVNGEPVASASVDWLWHDYRNQMTYSGRVITDTDGLVILPDSLPLQVSVNATGYYSEGWIDVTARNISDFIIHLDRVETRGALPVRLLRWTAVDSSQYSIRRNNPWIRLCPPGLTQIEIEGDFRVYYNNDEWLGELVLEAAEGKAFIASNGRRETSPNSSGRMMKLVVPDIVRVWWLVDIQDRRPLVKGSVPGLGLLNFEVIYVCAEGRDSVITSMSGSQQASQAYWTHPGRPAEGKIEVLEFE